MSYSTEKETDQEEKKTLTFETIPGDFNANIETLATTSHELARSINREMFSGVFDDYEGCFITPNMSQHAMSIELFFKPSSIVSRSTGKISALALLIDPQERKANGNRNRAGYDSIEKFNLLKKNKLYKLTDDAKELLSTIMPKYLLNRNTSQPNWDKCVFEIVQQANVMNGRDVVRVKIINIDLNSILKLMYGEKAPDGSKYNYRVNLGVPIPLTRFVEPNYVVTVQRVSEYGIKTICDSANISTNEFNGVNIVSGI